MTKWTPSIGWGWWLLIHIIAIPLLIYIGISLK
ncbi:hypothetical protein TheetDRAFT_2185 [Thermoanaerobacter ethanolicus JW 200]|uniref:Uncharacterized protein n=4 Tax=Thermoanaerobacter TaxID=1754 RepID=I9KU99_9THEO|nr:hypothetical protein Thebr_0727 [Thermoanaerobacter brockii subsp. finnii Ako-1]AEM79146.1 hypothetical protein Thewi_1751 [Thermoanaerobacter wiegelii Rt8.B1]EGD50997.1 hypothetical protein TheetDRAFT_2185 [Thermoanaerobacter ethanolicus JW 200]EIW00426.1 hypothetical protein ThesiDRAFT1_1491 [Thermoanaerobacter siderophilus SR4]EMT39252.1 hypothetical protein TthWC1_1167 [Thermoanaerobacter thermohydrosulfuricus WC1]